MINKLSEIQELLKTKTQTTGKLVTKIKGKYCFCVQGIFLLVCGGIIQKRNNISHVIFANDGESYMLNAPSKIFSTDLKIPYYVSYQYLRMYSNELNLTDEQLLVLNDSEENVCSWSTLNDEVKLTFVQFSILLGLLDNND